MGTIAVKVINHYGDEVLKVYEVVTSAGPGRAARAVPEIPSAGNNGLS